MKVFVVFCCDSNDGSILFIDRVYKDIQEATNYCCSQNADSINQVKGIYFDYQVETIL